MSEHKQNETVKVHTEESLRNDAVSLTKQVGVLDAEIKKLNDQRTAIQKDLRAVKSKLVTIELKKAAA